jgi:hypothetical protein
MKKSAVKKSAAVQVTLRRLGKPAGSAKVGEIVLVINPKLFGSTGSNWLLGKSFPTRDAALAAAKSAGATIAS